MTVNPYAKPVHLVHFMGPEGKISPYCYARPRAINLKKASWTLAPAYATCKKCLAALEAQRSTKEGE